VDGVMRGGLRLARADQAGPTVHGPCGISIVDRRRRYGGSRLRQQIPRWGYDEMGGLRAAPNSIRRERVAAITGDSGKRIRSSPASTQPNAASHPRRASPRAQPGWRRRDSGHHLLPAPVREAWRHVVAAAVEMPIWEVTRSFPICIQRPRLDQKRPPSVVNELDPVPLARAS